MQEISDADITAGLRRGDARAFDHAYARYRARVFGFLLRLSGRRDVAEDLFQETWMRLARRAPSLREDTDLAALLFTIARNLHTSHRRWAWLDRVRTAAYFDEIELVDEADPHTAVAARREIATLERALAALSVSDREVLLLVGVEGMGQDQAAQVLGIEHATMRQRVTRARARLAATIEAMEANRR